MRCSSPAVKRLRRLRADVRWQQARLIPRSDKQARTAAFAGLRKEFGFSEYALHAFATQANTSWIAGHLDANTAQTLATPVNVIELRRRRPSASEVPLEQAMVAAPDVRPNFQDSWIGYPSHSPGAH